MFWRDNAEKGKTRFMQDCLQNRILGLNRDTRKRWHFVTRTNFLHSSDFTNFPFCFISSEMFTLKIIIYFKKNCLKLSCILKILSMFLGHNLKNQSTTFQTSKHFQALQRKSLFQRFF